MPYDTRRSNQIFRCKKCSARNGRPAAGLHLQIRLHEGWNTGLCVAVDLMWAAFWTASNVSLDHSRWQILRRRYCHDGVQLHHRWCDRRFRPGLAPAGGGMEWSIHHLPDNSKLQYIAYYRVREAIAI